MKRLYFKYMKQHLRSCKHNLILEFIYIYIRNKFSIMHKASHHPVVVSSPTFFS